MTLAGRYRLVRCLAEGGMGAVYVAQALDGGSDVAVKLCTSAPRSEESVRGEIRMLRRLRQASVVTVLDEGTTPDGRPFFVMALLPGCDLGELLQRESPLDHTRVVRILESLADAIDNVHALGVVHGDIKPGNVFIGPNDEVTLIDFGLAVERMSETRNTPFMVLGTPEYMAPEQVLGVSGSVRAGSDRYAFAAIALEMLTGQRPYPSQTLGALLLSIIETRPRSPSELGCHAHGLDEVFARGMSRDPDRRFFTARAFVRAVAQVLAAGCESAHFADCNITPTVSIIPPAPPTRRTRGAAYARRSPARGGGETLRAGWVARLQRA